MARTLTHYLSLCIDAYDRRDTDNLDFSAVLAPVTMTETAGANTVQGGIGADTIVGGSGADVIYADNGGTSAVNTIAVTYASNSSSNSVTIDGTVVTYASATNSTTSAHNLAVAINSNAALTNIVTASDATGTVTLNWLVDGVQAATDTAHAGATVVITYNGSGASTVGVLGATAKNVLTGGAGADTFVFGATSVAPSDSIFNTITDFATASDYYRNSSVSCSKRYSSNFINGYCYFRSC